MTRPLVQGPFAEWELFNLINTQQLPYNVPSDPEYWAVFWRWPSPSVQAFSGQPIGQGYSPLIDVTFDVTLGLFDPSVSSAGILRTQLLYGKGGGYQAATIAPQPLNTTVEILDDLADCSPSTVAVAEQDPSALPVGGVTFPIWTQQSAPTLTVRTRANDAENPGYLWATAYVQINGTLNGPSPVVNVNARMRWRPVEGSP